MQAAKHPECNEEKESLENPQKAIDAFVGGSALHYGLPPVEDASDEELDFIINYDVKYRMSASAGEEDGDE